MRRFTIPLILSGAAVALLALLAFGLIGQGTNSSIDAQVERGDYPPIPNYSMSLPVLGSPATESLRDLRGKVVLVNIFASWCIPCAQEAPVLEHAQRLLRQRDGTVVGVTYLDNSSDDESFTREYHVTYPVLRDVSGDFARGLGTTGVPESFVINSSGRIQAVRRFQLTMQWLNQTLPKILAAPS